MQVKIAKGKNLIKFSFILIKEFRICSEIDTLLNKETDNIIYNVYRALAALELYVNKTTIIAIIQLILRSFQRKGLCNSGLKAKSTTFAYNNK